MIESKDQLISQNYPIIIFAGLAAGAEPPRIGVVDWRWILVMVGNGYCQQNLTLGDRHTYTSYPTLHCGQRGVFIIGQDRPSSGQLAEKPTIIG